MNELTPDDCAYFDACVVKWQQKLGLVDWRIERSNKRSKAMAEVSFIDAARLAVYKIGANFGAADVTHDAIERTALHELLHILLHDALENPSDATEHRVVNVLEKLLMDRQ